MKVFVEAWDPGYGSPVELGGEAEPVVDLAVERPMAEWSPVDAAPTDAPGVVVFVDGVRRIEARVWVEPDGGGEAEPGVCASWAAGAVVCDGRAEVAAVEVRRGLFSASNAAVDLPTPHGLFARRAARSGSPEDVWLAVQQAMTESEIAVSAQARPGGEGLLVVDGPLRDRQRLTDAIGMVKTHHTSYLPPELRPLLAALPPGTRTPVFRIGGRFVRQSWYLRLPGPAAGPMAGLVRCECSADLSTADAVRLAGWSAALLPRYASEPHKDSRAPQNLYPIAGLERELRRRLGDARLMLRAVRVAASATGAA